MAEQRFVTATAGPRVWRDRERGGIDPGSGKVELMTLAYASVPSVSWYGADVSTEAWRFAVACGRPSELRDVARSWDGARTSL